MDKTCILIILATFCCLLIVSIAIAVPVTISAEEHCSDELFHDLPSEFFVEEKWFSTRSRANIYDRSQKVIGSYTTKPNFGKTSYRYRDKYDNVVGKSDIGSFRYTYKISHCLEEIGPKYELEQHVFNFDKVRYDLRKNGIQIGKPSKEIWFQCKPDVAIEDNNGTLLATIGRSCGDSWFRDKWHIQNFQPDLVENYVLGFIAYITTQFENSQEAINS